MVIEHSLMNKSYTAKIDITNLLRTYNETKIAKTKQDYLKKDKILQNSCKTTELKTLLLSCVIYTNAKAY